MSADDETDSDEEFLDRRAAARDRIDHIAGASSAEPDERLLWFEEVYRSAEGDAAGVPWADLAPKAPLVDWLARNPGDGEAGALDIACGLGDNAEALSAAGYRTSAFDLARGAIDWARRRFPDSRVDYRVGDLFAPPEDWIAGFDLVHECYTLQALSGDLRERGFAAVTRFLRPGGHLLVFTRTRPNDAPASGPPWPLTPGELARFEDLGLERLDRTDWPTVRPDKTIPNVFIVYRRPA